MDEVIVLAKLPVSFSRLFYRQFIGCWYSVDFTMRKISSRSRSALICERGTQGHRTSSLEMFGTEKYRKSVVECPPRHTSGGKWFLLLPRLVYIIAGIELGYFFCPVILALARSLLVPLTK